jgi:hypothetical protein
MKAIKKIVSIVTVVLITSCSSTIKFPVSQITPAADITAKSKKQGKSNYLVTIKADNLANSERLNPPKKTYVIWVVSDSGVIRNVGNFAQKNAVSATYNASFPYKPIEIFITAEEVDGLCEPAGIEISRVKL